MWMMGIYVMNDHNIQKQQYNECMNKLEKLNNINYDNSFENGILSEGHPASQYPTQDTCTKST
jgi:hypothetical protein